MGNGAAYFSQIIMRGLENMHYTARSTPWP